MISRQGESLSVGKRALGIALALVVGALLPLITVLQITLLLPVLMLGGVFAVYLLCSGGWLPAGLFLAVGLASTAWVAGTELMWMILAAAMLPAIPVMRGIALKRPFFEQLRSAVVLYILGLLAAMVIAYARFGAGMVARLMDAIRAEFDRMPDAAFKPLVDAVNSALALSGTRGFGPLTVMDYRAQISGVLDLMERTYAQSLPGTLLSGAVLSGVASTLWGNWTMARRGMATDDSFVGMSRWFLPGRVTLGALVFCIGSYIAANSGLDSAETVYVTAYQVTGALFGIQAVASFDRRMVNAGRSLARRRVLLGLLIAGAMLVQLIAMVLFIYGSGSALFGSRGAIRLWLDKRRDDHSNHDDFEQ